MKKQTIHPLDQAIHKKVSPVYWHSRVMQADLIKQATERHTSVELDVAFDPDTGKPYVGHPKSFYLIEKKIPLPQNIALDQAIDLLLNSDVLVVLDCKNASALPTVEKIINTLGLNRCLLHAYIGEWAQPYPNGVHIEAHWPDEDLPYAVVKDFVQTTGAKCCAAFHAITIERMEKEKLLDRVLVEAQGLFPSINLYLPEGALPPLKHLQRIADSGYLPWLNYDLLGDQKPDFLYLGMTDNPALATRMPELYTE